MKLINKALFILVLVLISNISSISSKIRISNKLSKTDRFNKNIEPVSTNSTIVLKDEKEFKNTFNFILGMLTELPLIANYGRIL